MKHVTTLLLLLLCWSAQAATELPLRILLTSDLHMQLLDHDSLADRPVQHYGLVRTASLIHAAKAEQPNHLLFDNGDLLQGAPMGDWLARVASPRPSPHPAYQALQRLGYDAANLGNHDFDFGLDALRQAMAGSQLPVLNANLLDARSGRPAFRPTLMLTRRVRDSAGRWHRLRIGVLGLAPPQTLLWNRAVLGDRLRAQGMLEAASEWLPRLREQGADLVVVLAHTGIGENSENAALSLARLPGVNALLLGHAHGEFPGSAGRGQAGVDAQAGRLHGVPALMPGRWGDHLGVLDLRLQHHDGRWQVIEAKAELRPVRGADGVAVPGDAELRAWLQTLQAPVQDWVNAPLASSRQPLHSHFAQWRPSRLVALVQQAQAAWVRPRLAGHPDAALPLLSAAAPMRTATSTRPDGATDIPAGALRLRHLADLYPYPNTVQVLRINGAELRAWLERAAQQFQLLDPDGPPLQTLLDDSFPGYNFDQIDGLSYRIDVAQPSGQRIQALSWQGQPVGASQWFLLVTNSYRAGGGGGYPRLPADRLVLDLADETRQVIAEYARAQAELDLPLPTNWSLQLPTGIRAALPLTPKAGAHLQELGAEASVDEAGTTLRWRP